MTDLEGLIREYCDLLNQEKQISDRKDAIKAAILAKMVEQSLEETQTLSGSVAKSSRFRLTPRRDAVLSLLDAEDLFPFAQFTPDRVKQHLVPRYGRERLLSLFDVEKTTFVQVKRPPGSFRSPSGSPPNESS